MSFYKARLNWQRKTQTRVNGVFNTMLTPVECDLGSPVVDDTDWIVANVNMKVGAYTLAHTAPDVPRNITVKVTATDAADTMGTVTVTGTDRAGAVISEVITPVAGSTVAGNKAFKTVTSVVGAGWVTGGGADKIEVGFGGKIGLPDLLPHKNVVLVAVLNGTREATLPTVTASTSVLAENTVDFNSAWDGNAASVIYMI